ncbi:hypothetical protein H5410_056161, partial [Solanum commersonii]
MSFFVFELSRLSNKGSKEAKSRLMILVQQRSSGPDPSSASAPTPRNMNDHMNKMFQSPSCAKCGRTHLGEYRDCSNGSYKCGHMGHFMIEYHKNNKGNTGNRARSSSTAPADRNTQKGDTLGTY